MNENQKSTYEEEHVRRKELHREIDNVARAIENFNNIIANQNRMGLLRLSIATGAIIGTLSVVIPIVIKILN